MKKIKVEESELEIGTRVKVVWNEEKSQTIRDIKYLSKEIDQKISLGLLVDNTILEEFENSRKSNNAVFAGTIDFIYEFFQVESRAPKFLSKKLFTLLNNSKLLSRYSSIIADKGI